MTQSCQVVLVESIQSTFNLASPHSGKSATSVSMSGGKITGGSPAAVRLERAIPSRGWRRAGRTPRADDGRQTIIVALSQRQQVGIDIGHNVSYPDGQTGSNGYRQGQYFEQGDQPWLYENQFCLTTLGGPVTVAPADGGAVEDAADAAPPAQDAAQTMDAVDAASPPGGDAGAEAGDALVDWACTPLVTGPSKFVDTPADLQAPATASPYPEAELGIYPGSGFLEFEVEGPYTQIEANGSLPWSIQWRVAKIPSSVTVGVGSETLAAFARQQAAL